MVISMRHTLLLCFLTISACTRISDEELAWRTGDGGPDPSDCEDAPAVWTDEDGDGYGSADLPEDPCAPSELAVQNDLDCDDADALIHPDAIEDCETDVDDNCDESTNALDAIDCEDFYLDADADGYGLAADSVCVCEAWESYTTQVTNDCDDTEASVSPAAEEICNNGIDDDCDGGAEACELSGERDAVDAFLRILGAAGADVLGRSVSVVGDVDGDGLDDVLLGASGGDSGGASSGHVYVISGVAGGTIDLSTGDGALIYGDSADDRLGWAVSGHPDVDGDGYGEVALGTLYDSDGAYRAGSVHVFSGPIQPEQSVADLGVKYTGSSDEDYAGSALDWVGDMNGDGEPDLVVGAYRESSVASVSGAAYIIPGPHDVSGSLSTRGHTILGENWGDRAGVAVAGIGDVDGDGLDDIAIGADREDSGASNAGAVYVLLGPVDGDLSLEDADARYLGVEENQNAGFAVAGAGDLNGDGYADLVIGGPGQDSTYTQRGAAWVLLGPLTDYASLSDAEGQILGRFQADRFGHSVSGAGDVDGDGLDDIWVGAPEMGVDPLNPTGAAILLYGPVSGGILADDADFTVWGDATDDEAGHDVSGGGDINGDGRPDLVVGISDSDENGSLSGSALVILGGGL